MNKRLLAVTLTLPWLCLLGWVLFLTASANSGKQITLPVTGYDPRDLLSGRYIAYQIDWDKADCTQFDKGICPKEEFCKEARWGRECRFYIPEATANELDSLFRRRNRDLKFEVVYAYRSGQTPIAKQLLINGKDWQAYLKDTKIQH